MVCAGASFVAKVLAEYTLTAACIDDAEGEAIFSHALTDINLQLNRARWEHLLEKHSGKLPLKILAIPDRTVVPPLTPMLVVYNTDPEFPWLRCRATSSCGSSRSSGTRALWPPSRSP